MDASVVVPLLTGSGVAGIVLALFVMGWIHSDREFSREVARGDALGQAVKEKDKALEAANARADAAVRASELIADAFADARKRRATTGRPHG